jgi:hypothetical protein
MGLQWFIYDERLGIELPRLKQEWHVYSNAEREALITQWEQIRGSIPDKIKKFEHVINQKQAQLNNETDFVKSCQLNSDIAEYASRINDLHIWFRMNQDV